VEVTDRLVAILGLETLKEKQDAKKRIAVTETSLQRTNRKRRERLYSDKEKEEILFGKENYD
jgi:hypothetical protein